MKTRQTLVLLTSLVFAASGAILAASPSPNGRYIGRVVAEWLPGPGRRMKLVEPFAYVDPRGQRWDAPKGSVVDGASIPRIFWTTIGGPFDGPYRDASVIHDVACKEQRRPWQAVHRTFYSAMLASNVGSIKAKVMYAGVYKFGPRWSRSIEAVVLDSKVQGKENEFASMAMKGEVVEITTSEESVALHGEGTSRVLAEFQPENERFTESDFARLQHEIETTDISLEEIEDFHHDPREDALRRR